MRTGRVRVVPIIARYSSFGIISQPIASLAGRLECFRRRSKSRNDCSGERQGRARSLGERGVSGDPVQREEQAGISGRVSRGSQGQLCCVYVLTIGPVVLSRGGVS